MFSLLAGKYANHLLFDGPSAQLVTACRGTQVRLRGGTGCRVCPACFLSLLVADPRFVRAENTPPPVWVQWSAGCHLPFLLHVRAPRC